MSRLIDRFKGTLQGMSYDHTHDHEPSGANGHDGERAQAAPQAAEHEHRGAHEHDKKAHKHC